MKKSIQSVFLAFVFLTVIVSACAPASTPPPTSIPPTSTLLPTDISLPTKTPVPTRTPIPPTATIQAPDKTLEYLNGAQVVNIDTFDLVTDKWGSGLISGGISNGVLNVIGKDWNGIVRNRDFNDNQGIIIDFTQPKPDTNYSLLMALLPNGEFLGVIWDPSDPSETIFYREKIGKNWSNLTWTFAIGADRGAILFDNFREITFDSVK